MAGVSEGEDAGRGGGQYPAGVQGSLAGCGGTLAFTLKWRAMIECLAEK